jgi:signal transduction histidine kinase
VAQTPFQHKLAELQQHVSTLQHLAHGDPAQRSDSLLLVFAGFRRSLEELQALITVLPDRRTDSIPPRNGNHTRVPQLGVVANDACDAGARTSAEHDVTRYQERVRSLMADLLLVEERERRRLAVDLHDGLSQTIALVQIKLSSLRPYMDGKLASSLDEIEALIEQANRAARSISFELSPPVLHDLGLEPAVQWLVENIQARYGIEIVLEDDGQPKPADEKTRVILFRSIRELLINAAKHAGARRVRVCLARDDGQLNALVEDDGIGMEADVMGVKGSGLFSIHERLSHVGGSMRIEASPGRGTRIRLRAPLTNDRSLKASVEA